MRAPQLPPVAPSVLSGSPKISDERKLGILLGLGEALALISLYFTEDMSQSVAGALLALALFCSLRRPAFSVASLFALLVLLTSGTILLASIKNTHPALIAAQVLPLGHAILWFGGATQRFQGARLGISLSELILASVLTADLYLAFSLFFFGLLGTTILRARFALQDLKESRPKRFPPTLNSQIVTRSFLGRGLGLGVLTFLAGFSIYPLLPRVSGNLQQPVLEIPRNKAEVGLSESIAFLRWNLPLTGLGDGAIALRIFLQDKEKDLAIAPGALIRGKSLERLTRDGWRARDLPSSTKNPELLQFTEVEILREYGTGSDILFAPYGSEQVWVSSQPGGEQRILVRPRADGSFPWLQPDPRGTRYWVRLPKTPQKTPLILDLGKISPASDPLLLEVPLELRDEKTQALAARLFGTTRSLEEKLQVLRNLFLESGTYAASAEGIQTNSRVQAAGPETSPPAKSPLATFLHETRKGHCEAFASATAVLLRLSGTPARLVSGFRINRLPTAGVSLIRQGDAHAWVEAWAPETGWVPVDFTPRTWFHTGLFEQLRDRYESTASYWARYVVAAGDFQEAVPLRVPALDFVRDHFHHFLARHPFRALLILGLLGLLAGIRHFLIHSSSLRNDWSTRLDSDLWNWLPRLLRQGFQLNFPRRRSQAPPRWLLKLRRRGELWLKLRSKLKDIPLSAFDAWDSPKVLGLLAHEQERKIWLDWVAAYEATRFGPSERHRSEAELRQLTATLEKWQIHNRDP